MSDDETEDEKEARREFAGFMRHMWGRAQHFERRAQFRPSPRLVPTGDGRMVWRTRPLAEDSGEEPDEGAER